VGLLSWPASAISQTQDITCDSGNGEYSTQFFGVTISVAPVHRGGFAERTCGATLSWNDQEMSVESDAAQVGIDVLGSDLGFGHPVVSFQIDRSVNGTARMYRIYSLTKPPRLLYTLAGGHSYSAADTDLDDRIEIWTDDAAGVDGFEGVPLKDLDLVPTVVFRFEKGRLTDASSEFRSQYDMQISSLRAQLDPRDLADFKNSDGVLSMNMNRALDQFHRLIRTKIKVLEIVWLYLYSGRDQKAWSALADMWPSSDQERIRLAIIKAHNDGILRNVAGVSHRERFKYHAEIYDVVSDSGVVGGAMSLAGGTREENPKPPVIQPRSILLRRLPLQPGEEFSRADEVVELVVDAAGKVRSAKIMHGEDKKLIEATAGWQFIPAFRDGAPVACRFRLKVWNLQ
jgi:hypothetical protein